MKIVLINNLYGEISKGGAEKIVELCVEELSNRNFDVLIISTIPKFFIKNKIKFLKYKVTLIHSFYYYLEKFPIFLRFFWHIWDMFDIVSAVKVYFILKKEKPDLVITHNLKGISFLIPLIIKALKIKHIHILHDIQLLHPSGLIFYGKEDNINSFWAKKYQNINKFFFNSSNFVISPSKWLMQMHLERNFFLQSQRKVLRNPINFTINKTEIITNNSNFRFIYVGQIAKHKGVDFLIKTFKQFKSSKKCELLIIGDGEMMGQIKKLAIEDRRIKILGKKNKEEVKQLMLKSHCLVVPSLCYENSPTVIYEALSVGLPVIASKIGGIEELIEDKKRLFELSEKKLLDSLYYAINNNNNFKNCNFIDFYDTKKYIDILLSL